MDYEAVGNSDLFRGTVLVAVGAFVFSAGWFLLGICKGTDDRLKAWRWFKDAIMRRSAIGLVVAILIFGGSIMVGMGGTLTTKGWNFLNSHEEKQALIQAVFNEWTTNTVMGMHLPYDLNDEEVGRIALLYPVFKSSVLGEVLTSSLFTLDNTTDRELMNQIMRYEQSISVLNYLLRQIDFECTRMGVTKKERRAKYREVNDSAVFRRYLDCHRATGELLKSKYSWTLSGIIGQRWEQLMKKETPPNQKDKSVK